ncbi:protein STICHEL-like [Dendrobium catenatum]|uniref:protein STICHEL-like n=1 Tax=Dendrobium catenatum TaxID=906689 RepID=UPI0010A05560|nr:protein STICHEL-like [Dendrobium catenatum]
MADIKKCSAFSSRSSNLRALRELSSASVTSIRSTRPTPCGHHTPSRMLTAVEPAKIQSVKSSSEDALLLYDATQKTWKLSEIWRTCIEKCYSKTLRQMLSVHGKLISLTENEGILIAFIAFVDSCIKLRAERYSSSIANLLEMVLKRNVRVKMGLIPDGSINFKPPLDSHTEQYMAKLEFLDNQRKMLPDGIKGSPYKDGFEGAGHKKLEKCSSSFPQDDTFQSGSSSGSSEENDWSSALKEKGMEIAVLNMDTKTSSNGQKLENAWMQDAENGISGFPVLSKTNKNISIHHNGWNGELFYDPSVAMDRPMKRWENERNHGINALKLYDIQTQHKSQVVGDKINYAISPSLLHSNSFGNNFGKENLEYESGPGCSGLFCWKTNRPHKHQVKPEVHRKFRKASHILLCGRRAKSRMRREPFI